jgi:hypothetical protein
LEKEIDALRSKGDIDKKWYRTLVSLRNQLRPSISGAFDGFESALRNLQLSFTSCPNPFYEEIAFTVTTPFAEAVVKDRERHLVEAAAKAFINARKQARG